MATTRTFEIMPRNPEAKGLAFQSSIYEPLGNAHNLICEVYTTEEAEYIKQRLNTYDSLLAALAAALDSLEYVEWHHPGLSGYAVRQRRIELARTVIANAKGE